MEQQCKDIPVSFPLNLISMFLENSMGYLSFDIPLPHLHRPGLLLGTLAELSQRHLIPRLTLAATPPAGSPGAANPVDTAHLSPTYRTDL